MKYEVRISGKTRTVEVERHAGGWQATLEGGVGGMADVVETTPNTFSVLLAGQAHEISVTPSPDGKLNLQSGGFEFIAEVIDPRSWRGRHHGGVEAEGRQQVVAPMPGKVIRVLVSAGDRVEAGEALVVLEAMKMETMLRAEIAGTVSVIGAEPGVMVDAGVVLVELTPRQS
jgi:acetyl-CoA/propionyl-CoA carboxylase, biotin carboxylase, biotin carboxyl carrier protein